MWFAVCRCLCCRTRGLSETHLVSREQLPRDSVNEMISKLFFQTLSGNSGNFFSTNCYEVTGSQRKKMISNGNSTTEPISAMTVVEFHCKAGDIQ